MKNTTQTRVQRNRQTRVQQNGRAKAQPSDKAVGPSKPAAVLPPPQRLHPSQRPQPAPGCSLIKMGLDVDLDQITTAIQYDHSAIKPGTGFSLEKLVEWVEQRVKEGHVVWSVYEACGFGYTLHRKLMGAGALSLVIAPLKLDPQRRLKNDRLDARALCTRLTRYVDGQTTELPVIRVPSAEQQQRRETARQRSFWKKQVLRLASHGRALRLEYEHKSMPSGWWKPGSWKKVCKEVSPFVRTFLEPLHKQVLECQSQVNLLTAQLEARTSQEKLPKGLGELTMALFDAEICDAARFSNRKQVGSYIGCCPSQHTSRGVERFGPIDRHGNKHLRVLLVEAVWRLVRYQIHWHAYKKLAVRLNHSKAIRKKTAIALSRQLAIDLWRVRTGRATWTELGLLP